MKSEAQYLPNAWTPPQADHADLSKQSSMDLYFRHLMRVPRIFSKIKLKATVDLSKYYIPISKTISVIFSLGDTTV